MKYIGLMVAIAFLAFMGAGNAMAVELDVCQKRYDGKTGNMVPVADDPEILRMCHIVKLQARMIKIMKLQQPETPLTVRIPQDVLELYNCEQGSYGPTCGDGSAGSVCRSLGFDAYVSHSYRVGHRDIDITKSDGSIERKKVEYISEVVCRFYPDAAKYELIEAQIQGK